MLGMTSIRSRIFGERVSSFAERALSCWAIWETCALVRSASSLLALGHQSAPICLLMALRWCAGRRPGFGLAELLIQVDDLIYEGELLVLKLLADVLFDQLGLVVNKLMSNIGRFASSLIPFLCILSRFEPKSNHFSKNWMTGRNVRRPNNWEGSPFAQKSLNIEKSVGFCESGIDFLRSDKLW